MSKTVVATQLDADICNVVESPVRGCHAGAGLHVVIPADWQTRILTEQDVPGCSYHRLDFDGASSLLTVSNFAIAQLLIPAVVNALTPGQQTEVTVLNAKLALAQSQAMLG